MKFYIFAVAAGTKQEAIMSSQFLSIGQRDKDIASILYRVFRDSVSNILAEDKRALGKVGNGPSFYAKVGGDLGHMAGIAHLILQRF